MPSSRSGEASRQSRIAWPSPVAAAVIGFGDSRGSCSDSQGRGTTIGVELLGQRDPAERDAAQERLGVGDGGWPGEHRDRGELPPELLQRQLRIGPGSTLTSRRSGECAIAVSARGEEG